MRNEGFDQISAGVFDRFGAAEVRSVRLDQIRIELILANQQAKLIAEPGRVGLVTVAVARR